MLETTHLNQAQHWFGGREFFQKGVIVPARVISAKTVESKIAMIEKFYPIVQGSKAFGCAVHEGLVMRGLHVLGDDDDIARFWMQASELALSVQNLKTFDLRERAMLWTALVPNTVYVPYLDFDEQARSIDHYETIMTGRVLPAIGLVTRAIAKAASVENVNWQMYQNVRQLSDGRMKFSFHVHFYDIGILNINVFKLLLSNMSDLPRKLLWKNHLGNWIIEEDLKPLVDTGVYGGRNQLFRGPYCGKKGDAEAVLKPVSVSQDDGKWKIQVLEDFTMPSPLTKLDFILRARIARSPKGLKIIDFGDHIPAHLAPLPSSDSSVHTNTVTSVEHHAFYEFFQPLLFSSILPAWQEFRYQHLVKQSLGGGATVPRTSLRIIKNEPHRAKAGIRWLTVQGDTYCMMDANHFHSQNPRTIGVVVDFVHCRIQQSCYACGRPSMFYCFLHLANEIRVEEEARSKFSHLKHFEHSQNPHQFILDYFADLFRFHRITEAVWVYDEDSRVWKTDQRGTRVVGMLIDRVNSRYNAYLNERQQLIMNELIAARDAAMAREGKEETKEQKEAYKEGLITDGRKFLSEHSNIIRLSATTRGKIIDEIKQYRVREEVSAFNPHEFLIPMKNLSCLNVFTLETEEIRPNHFLTGVLNAEILSDTSSPDFAEVDQWFLEIATGNQEKADYLKLLAGYLLTMSVHDRKLYVMKGTGKNGKGIFKQFLLNILEGPEGAESRWASLKPQYWAARATSNENPEGASPSTQKMLHKAVLYTDDMDRSHIDSCRVKRIVAGEPQESRKLYGNPIQFQPTAKILWTSNFVPDGPGNDHAYWERFVMISMLTKYTPYKDRVDEKNYIFPMNSMKCKNLLEKRDVFFTLVVRQLHKYYRSLPWNKDKNEPLELASFPLPKIVEDAGREARETQLPLASFIREYTVPCNQPLQQVEISALFHAYMIFLENSNERRMKNETTQTSFIRLLTTGLEINVHSTRVELKMKKQIVSLKEQGAPSAPWPVREREENVERGPVVFCTGDAPVSRPVHENEERKSVDYDGDYAD